MHPNFVRMMQPSIEHLIIKNRYPGVIVQSSWLHFVRSSREARSHWRWERDVVQWSGFFGKRGEMSPRGPR